ncbi:MAG: GntR family transcriptional regulator [Clostridia bacterium]|jgi:GntR family transcriptional repressor for pyruvate dehydrogenase complex|nr:GntR family transcriptional regulator [Clostridia bacterium]MCI2000564.1 GntR family transcriptional regulator [Clostridia bacterium]MCI2015020.1 GntR family transcriptional regulator [Clostridia bacterium]
MQENQNSQKIERISVVDQIGDALKQQILNGNWKAGDKLPSETEIAKMYGVNRLSVRMALQKLSTLGVIDTRVGEGSFVRNFSIYPVLNEIVDFYASEDRIDDIREMRRIIEKESAVKAASLATSEELNVLKQYLDNYRQMFDKSNLDDTDENFCQLVNADFDFHSQIVHISHNRLFEEIYFMIQKLVTKHIVSLINRRRYFEKNSNIDYEKMHERLYTSICMHDEEAVRRTIDVLLYM